MVWRSRSSSPAAPRHASMWYRSLSALALLCAAPGVALSQLQPAGNGMLERYRRAEAMLTWNSAPLVKGDVVTPQWIDGGPRFWYRVTRRAGADFVLVDPV